MLHSHPLWPSDAVLLAQWFKEQPEEHLRYFQPFGFDEESLGHTLGRVKDDFYLGFFLNRTLVMLLLLRGWDENFLIPMYGICVDHRHLRKGWGRLSIQLARTLSRERGAEALRLKVHPDNRVARHLYEMEGFGIVGVDPKGDLIYEVALT